MKLMLYDIKYCYDIFMLYVRNIIITMILMMYDSRHLIIAMANAIITPS